MVELRQSVATRYGRTVTRVVIVPPEVPAGDLSTTIGSYPYWRTKAPTRPPASATTRTPAMARARRGRGRSELS
jgi:hypothetical protein